MTRDSSPTVLIIGQRPDPHIEAVCAELARAGIRTIVLDRHSSDTFSIGFSNGKRWVTSCVSGQVVDLQQVRSVWWRVKPAPVSEFPGGKKTIAEAFRWQEWKALLRGLPEALPRAKWVNPVPAHLHASKKINQLILAESVGLEIPDTVITNSAAHVLRLFERNKRVVYKTLSSFLVPPDRVIFTNEVSQTQILEEQDSIHLAPCIFQGYVEKVYEVRTTVVGDRLFPVRINSQDTPSTRIDWRHDQSRDMYSEGDLTPRTKSRLLEFHRRAQLLYAAYDFIVRPDGSEVFLESNPGGQWLWLEKATGCAISCAVAELLASG